MEFNATYKNGRLLPMHDSDYEKMKKLREGQSYKIVATQPRNYEFHKKYMALINLAYANQETFNNFESCRKWLQMKAGYYVETITPSGVMYEPQSISFAAMDELEFQELYSKVLDQVCKWLGVREGKVMDQITQFM